MDVPNVGSDIVFVRLGSNKDAQEFCGQELNRKKEILSGEEEKSYWDKLLLDRAQKFKKDNSKGKKKQRGRDKLLKKANKVMATHIKFDE